MVKPVPPVPRRSRKAIDPNETLVPDGPSRGKTNLEKALTKTATDKALVTVLDGWLTRDRPMFDLAEPVMLTAKGRVGMTAVWKPEAFNGGEHIQLTTAYLLDGKITMTGQPDVQKIAFVRLTFEQAVDHLNGFEGAFNSFLESVDGSEFTREVAQAFEQAKREQLERAKADAGNNPDFGTW